MKNGGISTMGTSPIFHLVETNFTGILQYSLSNNYLVVLRKQMAMIISQQPDIIQLKIFYFISRHWTNLHISSSSFLME